MTVETTLCAGAFVYETAAVTAYSKPVKIRFIYIRSFFLVRSIISRGRHRTEQSTEGGRRGKKT
jgi:hypothetical protein